MFALELVFEFLIVALLLFIYMRMSHRYHWFDAPNEDRKIHSNSKPTSTGLVFIIPTIALLILFPFIDSIYIALMTSVLLVLGGVDDFKNISSRLRLVFQFIVSALLLVILYNSSSLAIYFYVFYFIGLVWWLNLYNFMDGADGMAGLHAIVTLIAYYYLLQDSQISIHILVLLVSIIAFLPFNFPQSKMFMGDSGSLTVAFLLAFCALFGISNDYFGELLVLSFHLVFIVDASLTLIFRLRKKHKITQAHNLHLYQSLIHHGMSHWKISTIYGLISAFIIILTLYLHELGYDLQTKLLVLTVEISILVILWFKFQDKSRFDLK